MFDWEDERLRELTDEAKDDAIMTRREVEEGLPENSDDITSTITN